MASFETLIAKALAPIAAKQDSLDAKLVAVQADIAVIKADQNAIKLFFGAEGAVGATPEQLADLEKRMGNLQDNVETFDQNLKP